MGVNSLPKTVTRQCRGCDLNPGPYTAPESSTLTTRLPSQQAYGYCDYTRGLGTGRVGFLATGRIRERVEKYSHR